MNVLVNAYACCPHSGSEPGMAWNWCSNLAKYCELFIITEEEFRDKIEAEVNTLPQGKNMHFYYNPVTPKIRKMCWNQGDWRFYIYYRMWQIRTLEIAKKICSEHEIDILHQLNMIGYREPGLLWKIKGPKFVWGPLGGVETIPVAYLKGSGFKTIAFGIIKNSINSLQYRYQPNVRSAIKKADAIIAATSSSQHKLQDFYHKDISLINETGCIIYEDVDKSHVNMRTLKMLWVGKMDFRKQLALAVKVLGALKDLDICLQVCGNGTTKQIKDMRDLASKLGVSKNLNYLGVVSHEEVQHLMRNSDIFLFTSIVEGTPHVVLEAIANHLPVICIDTCGQADCVTNETGRKVRLSSPKQTINDMAAEIRGLYHDRDEIRRLSDNCVQASHKMSWDVKIKSMLNIYQNICK